MEFQQLRNFLCVAEYKNISRAARELRISQPALSRSIHALEEDVGAVLVERGSSGVKLTAQGEVLAQRARDILAMESCARRELRHASGQGARTIRVIYRCIESFLMDVLSRYRQRAPEVCFSVLQNDDIALQNHEYDLVVSGALADESGYVRTRLLTERLLCALPADHPFARQKAVRLEQFAALPQIRFGGHRQIQRLIWEHLHSRGLDSPPSAVCDDVRTGCGMVAHGFGALLIPEYAPDDAMLEQIRLLSVEGIELSREVYLYHRAQTYLPQHIQDFEDFLIAYFRKKGL